MERRSEYSPAGSASHPEKEKQRHDLVRKFALGKRTQISVPAVLLFHTSLKVLYLNGMTAKATVDLDIRGDRYTEFTAVLKELIGYEGTLKLYGS